MYAPLINELAKYYTVVAPDLPGHGGSGSFDEYPVDLFLEAIQTVVTEVFSDQSFITVGHSMGGMLAVAFHAQNDKSTSCIAFAPAGIKTIATTGETFGKVFNKLISADMGFKALVKDQWARSGKFIGKEKFDDII